MVKIVNELAPAKLNLGLRVIKKRDDGYHELDSVIVPVSLYDRVTVELRDRSTRSVKLTSDGIAVPCDSSNLAARAAHAFLEEFDLRAEVTIGLHKAIPPGAGLGGGSSDAAAVLRAMASLSRRSDTGRLAALALEIGADVPFFLRARPARARGVGELLEEFPCFPTFHLVLMNPPVEVSTAAVFRALRPEHWNGPFEEETIRELLEGHVTPYGLANDLEKAATEMFPIIAEFKSKLEFVGAHACAMTGSGGCVFGLFRNGDEAEQAAGRARVIAEGAQVYAVHTT